MHQIACFDGLSRVAVITKDKVGQALTTAELPKYAQLSDAPERSEMPDLEVHIDLVGVTRPVGGLLAKATESSVERFERWFESTFV
ncbi:hypothetical protein NKI56_34190 [Mesorhizobium sp. M0622]|uniref:hypothetical protein n=1 Tax=Mesorhizobium sp. M0622 TaxID=2956975 RepID=UPI00333CE0A7